MLSLFSRSYEYSLVLSDDQFYDGRISDPHYIRHRVVPASVPVLLNAIRYKKEPSEKEQHISGKHPTENLRNVFDEFLHNDFFYDFHGDLWRSPVVVFIITSGCIPSSICKHKQKPLYYQGFIATPHQLSPTWDLLKIIILRFPPLPVGCLYPRRRRLR